MIDLYKDKVPNRKHYARFFKNFIFIEVNKIKKYFCKKVELN